MRQVSRWTPRVLLFSLGFIEERSRPFAAEVDHLSAMIAKRYTCGRNDVTDRDWNVHSKSDGLLTKTA